MTFVQPDRMNAGLLIRYARRRFAPNRADIIALFMIAGAAVVVTQAARTMGQPLAGLTVAPISLDPINLPRYAALTTLRMFAALACSLLFTFVVATLAAKSKKAELVIVPALDILQSVPVLGFLTFTVTFFMGLFPGNEMGVEAAAIFAIFTAQAWNMAFSFYQSLKTLPEDLDEAAKQFGLSAWQRFWKLELPFATPALVWNTMMSMSGSWFFIVASEAITVGKTQVALPGIGAWLAVANERGDGRAVAWAVATMAVVIVLYDQLLFRPIVAWADKFRAEQTASQDPPRSWFYDLIKRMRLLPRLVQPMSVALNRLPAPQPPNIRLPEIRHPGLARGLDWLWLAVVIGMALWGGWAVVTFVSKTLTVSDAFQVFGLGALTLARVLILIVIASIIWVPIGVWIGLRPIWAERIQPVAQFFAAFPANVLFPAVVGVIVALHADPNIWLSPLMILGTQWYILFNVIAGAAAIPNDLKEAASIFQLSARSWQWWRTVALPGIFPYYITGALTASGGSWNASIVAEVVTWRHQNIEAAGLGSYIADATSAGDYPKVALGIAVMSIFVILLNRTLWRPLYGFAARRLHL
jgi:NitT/TauT family transport system permease protein